MLYTYLADAVVALHVAYVGFIIVGQLVILAGIPLRWQWIRNFWFRLFHLLSISYVALEAIAGVACPLTLWEDDLRRLAGQTVYEGTFIGRFMHDILFYNADSWIFTASYITFALLVLLTFVIAPPRRPQIWKRRAIAARGHALARGERLNDLSIVYPSDLSADQPGSLPRR